MAQPTNLSQNELPSNAKVSLSGGSLIHFKNAGKYYVAGDVHALTGIDCEIKPGEHVAIVGKSGSGKSSLLNLIGGLDLPSSGEVLFRGKQLNRHTDLDQHRSREIGFVFQSYFLLPNLTAGENVQIPMFGSEQDPRRRQQRAVELLHQVGLGDRIDHRPNQLSGGESQRVAIARALANSPPLILADEPTGALDTESGTAILDLLETLHRETSVTLIVVTHDEAIAERAQRRLRLKDGRLVK